MYEQQILEIFSKVGKRGISVHSLAKHIYNMNNTLFEQPDYQQVIKEVRSFVTRKSRSKRPILQRTGRWGYYQLNKQGIAYAHQNLMAPGEAAAGDTGSIDQSLELFTD